MTVQRRVSFRQILPFGRLLWSVRWGRLWRFGTFNRREGSSSNLQLTSHSLSLQDDIPWIHQPTTPASEHKLLVNQVSLYEPLLRHEPSHRIQRYEDERHRVYDRTMLHKEPFLSKQKLE
ncbi:hypothetical protein Agabi119p4_4951 [Agaricus bisporus var. burnettii]|uniref:Uncharacterized protein n=1 Tax=Agaricus bisporus var. burnettii TaxID=192524 RepID=A0A8H7F4F3_AGABI|nr:hypothetical protein Agabi119p4_4951 [Agaricus bisporus var. burnettii]